MKTVLITGTRGFIAGHVARQLAADGHRVIGTSRAEGACSSFERVYGAQLGDSLWGVLTSERVDSVLHTALDAGGDAYARNVSGTTKWLQEAKQAGVQTQVFLSSLSADPHALSDYGRAKAALEQRFVEAGEIVFRLGVVVGPGGMFGRIAESATRYPVVPLLDGGAQLVYVVGIDAFARIVARVLTGASEELRGHAWNLVQSEPYPLSEVIAAVLRHSGRRRPLVPLPARPIASLLSVVERQRLVRLPVTSTNVRGLIQAGQRRFPSNYERFGYPADPLDDLVSRALAARS